VVSGAGKAGGASAAPRGIRPGGRAFLPEIRGGVCAGIDLLQAGYHDSCRHQLRGQRPAPGGGADSPLFEKSAEGCFDAILMDVMMPEMDGYEATERIRRLNRKDARTIPIIAMTANAFTEDKIRSKAAGVNEHIAKPLNTELVLQAVAKLVQPPVVD